MNAIMGLFAALVISLVPTLLFLGLWRGLMYLRDDALIERTRELEARRPSHSPTPRPTTGSSNQATRGARDATVVCATCGTHNATGMVYCWQCLAKLEE